MLRRLTRSAPCARPSKGCSTLRKVTFGLTFSTLMQISAKALLFFRAASRNQRRRSLRSPDPAAPREGAFALAWRVCRRGSRSGWLPDPRNLFCCVAASSDSVAFFPGVTQTRAGHASPLGSGGRNLTLLAPACRGRRSRRAARTECANLQNVREYARSRDRRPEPVG